MGYICTAASNWAIVLAPCDKDGDMNMENQLYDIWHVRIETYLLLSDFVIHKSHMDYLGLRLFLNVES